MRKSAQPKASTLNKWIAVMALLVQLTICTASGKSTPTIVSAEVFPDDGVHEEGDSVSLVCQISDFSATPYSVVWTKVLPEKIFIVSSENMLVPDDRYSVTLTKVQVPAEFVFNLTINSLRESDTGMYGCHIYERRGCVFHPIKRSTVVLTVVKTENTEPTTQEASTSSAIETTSPSQTTLQPSDVYSSEKPWENATSPQTATLQTIEETTPQPTVNVSCEGPTVAVLVATVISEFVLLIIIHIIIILLCFRFDPSHFWRVMDACASVPSWRKGNRDRISGKTAGKATNKNKKFLSGRCRQSNQPTNAHGSTDVYDLPSTSFNTHSPDCPPGSNQVQHTYFTTEMTIGDSDTSSCDSSAYEIVNSPKTGAEDKRLPVHKSFGPGKSASRVSLNSEGSYMDLKIIEQEPSVYTELKQ